MFITMSASAAAPDASMIDEIAANLGKDWRKLYRQLEFTDAELYHLEVDYQTSGQYEVMFSCNIHFLIHFIIAYFFL